MGKKIKCVKCGCVSKQGTKFCPECGEQMDGAEVITTHVPKKVFVLAGGIVVAVAIVAAAVFVIPNLNPKGKYQALMEQGKVDEADDFYEEKIASDEELANEVIEEEKNKIQQIYEEYKAETIDYDSAIGDLEYYLESTVTKNKANSIKQSIEKLKDSREAFVTAQEQEDEGDLEKALFYYKSVIEEDANYGTAIDKAEELNNRIRENYIADAADYADNKQYNDAISSIRSAINKCGTDDELEDLAAQYQQLKDEQYVKVVVTDKTVTPSDYDKWRFYDYVNFVFEITNNSGKDIKGIEGGLTISDLFGKEITTIGCDFTGHTIKKGEKYTNSDMALEVNPYIDEDVEVYSTDYSDLQFRYEVTNIVFSDGTSVTPE